MVHATRSPYLLHVDRLLLLVLHFSDFLAINLLISGDVHRDVDWFHNEDCLLYHWLTIIVYSMLRLALEGFR